MESAWLAAPCLRSKDVRRFMDSSVEWMRRMMYSVRYRRFESGILSKSGVHDKWCVARLPCKILQKLERLDNQEIQMNWRAYEDKIEISCP